MPQVVLLLIVVVNDKIVAGWAKDATITTDYAGRKQKSCVRGFGTIFRDGWYVYT